MKRTKLALETLGWSLFAVAIFTALMLLTAQFASADTLSRVEHWCHDKYEVKDENEAHPHPHVIRVHSHDLKHPSSRVAHTDHCRASHFTSDHPHIALGRNPCASEGLCLNPDTLVCQACPKQGCADGEEMDKGECRRKCLDGEVRDELTRACVLPPADDDEPGETTETPMPDDRKYHTTIKLVGRMAEEGSRTCLAVAETAAWQAEFVEFCHDCDNDFDLYLYNERGELADHSVKPDVSDTVGADAGVYALCVHVVDNRLTSLTVGLKNIEDPPEQP